MHPPQQSTLYYQWHSRSWVSCVWVFELPIFIDIFFNWMFRKWRNKNLRAKQWKSLKLVVTKTLAPVQNRRIKFSLKIFSSFTHTGRFPKQNNVYTFDLRDFSSITFDSQPKNESDFKTDSKSDSKDASEIPISQTPDFTNLPITQAKRFPWISPLFDVRFLEPPISQTNFHFPRRLEEIGFHAKANWN